MIYFYLLAEDLFWEYTYGRYVPREEVDPMTLAGMYTTLANEAELISMLYNLKYPLGQYEGVLTHFQILTDPRTYWDVTAAVYVDDPTDDPNTVLSTVNNETHLIECLRHYKYPLGGIADCGCGNCPPPATDD